MATKLTEHYATKHASAEVTKVDKKYFEENKEFIAKAQCTLDTEVYKKRPEPHTRMKPAKRPKLKKVGEKTELPKLKLPKLKKIES